MNFWKRQLPAIVVFAVGMLMVIQYYIPHPVSTTALEESARWVRILRNFALLLGVASLMAAHGRKIARKQAGFGYSALLFASFAAMTFCGLLYGIDAPRKIVSPVEISKPAAISGEPFKTKIEVIGGSKATISLPPGSAKPIGPIKIQVGDSAPKVFKFDEPILFSEKGELSFIAPADPSGQTIALAVETVEPTSPGFWMFQNIKVSCEATMYSLLAFFISSAAFRAFRCRSFDATLMLAAAIIMMIGRVSFGEIISTWFSQKWLFFPEACNWFLNVPMTAAKRAIYLGIALSVIATSVRILFGIERSYLGRSD